MNSVGSIAPSHTRRSSALVKLWKGRRTGKSLATVMMWLLVAVMVVPQGFDYGSLTSTPNSSDITSKLIWYTLLAGSFVLVAQNLPRILALGKQVNVFLLLYFLLALLSIAWSIEPSITLRRCIRAITAIMVCFSYCVVTWETKRPQETMRSILTAVMVSSIVFCIVDPINAIHQVSNAELKDAWHGITTGKNLLGSLASMCVVLWLHAWLSKEASGFKAFAGSLTAIICLVMSRSAASLLATGFAVTLFLILVRSPDTLKRTMPYLISLFAATVLIYALAVLGIIDGLDIILKPISALTGKDLTFTGRTAIWDILREHIALRPLLGSGYGAYWIGAVPTSPSYEMWTRLYFYPTEGHNGYLDVINDLGWVGFFCLIGYFASYLRQSIRLMQIDRYQGVLYLTLIFRGFLADMSESHWFVSLSIDYVIMTFMTVNLGRHHVQLRVQRAETGTVHTRGWRRPRR
jgi:exopolysaccharide production protein ExoQ